MPGPGGRHGWHGGRGVQRGQIARLLEPCLLALLRDGDRHGYDLIGALDRFGLAPGFVDSAAVYRALRDMEMAGWVMSRWDTGESGPPRRVYSLTAGGNAALLEWVDELERTHQVLHNLLSDLDRS